MVADVLFVIDANHVEFGGRRYRAAIGKGGIKRDKREGDGATPAGMFPMRHVYYREDRLSLPELALPVQNIQPGDHWCDAPLHPDYNHFVEGPIAASHEDLCREDGLYDVLVTLGYNDHPVLPFRGSAIFLHIAKPDYAPTEGCVALSKEDLLSLLPRFTPRTQVHVPG